MSPPQLAAEFASNPFQITRMNPQAEAANQRRLEREAASCIHFTGTQHDKCKAGLEYPRGGLPCIPPFKAGDVRPSCPKFQAMGMESVLKQEVEDNKLSDNINKARAAIITEANGRRGVQGGIPCPICNQGPLRYRVMHNGHVHAQCATIGCVRWME